ncbi:MaoC family dehydratase N-terminal domain-containing protein [Bradyrhizobium manausense]|uniref:MaoC family dehydratase N-terminal domain-containing protein n=1 Tax=Bradyrhizobium manausense TaxID=989370 RepID=UPI001BAAC3B8|nr:MaoC family dehydratase N-terminal domain-containing protein [Bradyrhizobium manausense]MBR0684380.1 MaoC family dehydratase N-terminal domain-containing protein [Bradyrhizobium manausense]
MIDPRWIGHVLPTTTFEIERSRLRFFAKAIGETDPVYTDQAAAREAGHPDLPAPPTFLFSAEMESDQKLKWLLEADIPLSKVLHGEQTFSYHRMVYAGDVVSVTSRVVDIYQKRNGALEFVVFDTQIARGEQAVCDSRGVLVIRH